MSDVPSEVVVIPRLAIIADDLTGALDAAAPFAGRAGVVLAATRPEALGRALSLRPDVVAVATRSREIPAATARERVAAVLAALPAGVRVIKKIDSRLKGNIAAELDAFGARRLVVLPAIPEFGRTVRAGALAGFGVERPIEVRSVLGTAGDRAQVPDVTTAAEMAAAVGAAPPETLLVGARGMAEALAKSFGLPPAAAPPAPPLPACVAIGSTDPITLAQVAALRRAWPRLRYVAGRAGRLPPPEHPGGSVLLQATPGGGVPPERVAAEFAATAVPYLTAARSAVLTGGATAEAVLDALGVDLLEVEGEALPGIPLCRRDGGIVLTKSGGFGAPDTLVRLLAASGDLA